MPVLLNVIEVLDKKFGAQYDKSTLEMPKWMLELHHKLAQPETTPKNVLLFLLKVLINKAEVFQAYHSLWLRPVLQAALTLFANDSDIHYFLRDICILLIKWRAVPANEHDRTLASNFLVCSSILLLFNHSTLYCSITLSITQLFTVAPSHSPYIEPAHQKYTIC
jgi:hypothetical protein